MEMKYFTIAELTHSDTAERENIANMPPKQAIANLQRLTTVTLDPAREQLGSPIRVNSGYRSPRLNRRVGGVADSLHMQGRAADLTTPSGQNRRLFAILQRLPHTELIWEKGGRWIHVAL